MFFLNITIFVLMQKYELIETVKKLYHLFPYLGLFIENIPVKDKEYHNSSKGKNNVVQSVLIKVLKNTEGNISVHTIYGIVTLFPFLQHWYNMK